MLGSMLRSPDLSTERRARALPRWISLAAGLLVVLGLLAGALHHHSAHESGQHPCVVCTLHHAPATPAVVAEPVPPPSSFERVAISDDAHPRTVSALRGPARAPPAV